MTTVGNSTQYENNRRSTSDLIYGKYREKNPHKVRLLAIEKKIKRDLLDGQQFKDVISREQMELMSNSEKYDLNQDIKPQSRYSKKTRDPPKRGLTYYGNANNRQSSVSISYIKETSPQSNRYSGKITGNQEIKKNSESFSELHKNKTISESRRSILTRTPISRHRTEANINL